MGPQQFLSASPSSSHCSLAPAWASSKQVHALPWSTSLPSFFSDLSLHPIASYFFSLLCLPFAMFLPFLLYIFPETPPKSHVSSGTLVMSARSAAGPSLVHRVYSVITSGSNAREQVDIQCHYFQPQIFSKCFFFPKYFSMANIDTFLFVFWPPSLESFSKHVVKKLTFQKSQELSFLWESGSIQGEKPKFMKNNIATVVLADVLYFYKRTIENQLHWQPPLWGKSV